MEIGSSHGMVSILAARMGAKKITACDQASVLSFLRDNIAMNQDVDIQVLLHVRFVTISMLHGGLIPNIGRLKSCNGGNHCTIRTSWDRNQLTLYSVQT